MHKIITIIILCSLSLLSACSDSNSPSSPAPFELFIEADDQQIHIGNNTYLKAYSRDLATGIVADITSSVSFHSNNPSIAQNERYGPVVNALAEGVATFNVSYYDESASTSIRVRDGYITKIIINSPDNHLHVDSSSQMTALATYDDDSTDDITDNAEWISETDWVAYLATGYGGLVVANNPGTTQVYALRNGIYSNFQEVSVHRGTMVGLEINCHHSCEPAHKGQTTKFYSQSRWADGDADNVTNSTKWLTSNARVLRQQDDSKSSFKAENTGKSAISGLYNSFEDTKVITVDRALVSNLRVEMDAEVLDIDRNGTNYWIPRGGSTQLTALGDLSDGTKDADVSDLVEWRWYDEGTDAEIEIDEQFVAHGTGLGMVIIYVQVDGTSSEYRGVTLWIGSRP